MKSMKQLFKKGMMFNSWELVSFLGGGGNGEVWACSNRDGEIKAIKILKHIREKPYARFVDETIVIDENSDIPGILPIVDKYLPERLSSQAPFFVMPLAQSSEKLLFGRSIEVKVLAILEIAETLLILHERHIYHRDIKPANILYYEGRFCLADFGLVHYPNKRDVSFRDEVIGAKWTMAPEMRRESSNADAEKADIYSLAKTLWIYLSEKTKGFDGQYSTDSVIELKKFYPKSYTSLLDNLLIECTDNDPVKRPTVTKFIGSLTKWKKLDEDFHRQKQQQWFEIQTKLFPTSVPKRVIWEDINDILKILKIVCSFENLNHVFMPNGGGLDLKDVRVSNEIGCLELDFQLIFIIKPKRLIFESFGYDHEWNYFRLELDELSSSDVHESEAPYHELYDYEEVSELSPNNYYPAFILQERQRYKRDYLFTQYSRRVSRWFRGSFVIFCKRSKYNLDSSTYDGRHNKKNTDEFREYIQRNVDIYKQKAQRASDGNTASSKPKDTKFEHYIEDIAIYRCGWCGNFVSEDGKELDTIMRNYYIQVFEKFGSTGVSHVHGYCCKDRRVE